MTWFVVEMIGPGLLKLLRNNAEPSETGLKTSDIASRRATPKAINTDSGETRTCGGIVKPKCTESKVSAAEPNQEGALVTGSTPTTA